MKYIFSLLAIALATGSAQGYDVTRNPELVAKLRMAATNADRAALLPNNEDWIFDFTKQSHYTYSPGSVVNANVASFPATVGHGLTIAMLNLGPCAMLSPHLHPRASNHVVAVEGETKTWMIQENGVDPIETVLTPGMMTIFPAGSLHTMQNLGCGNATLVSSLNSEDPGTLQIANQLFNLPKDMIQASFGNNPYAFDAHHAGASIPPVGTGSVLGSAECLARCGML